MTPVAPRIVNNVSFVSRINHEIHFSWQAQYLVKLNCQLLWHSRSGKCCIFQCKMLAMSAQSNLGCEAGRGVTGSCSDCK